jgi:hypothetical protein
VALELACRLGWVRPSTFSDRKMCALLLFLLIVLSLLTMVIEFVRDTKTSKLMKNRDMAGLAAG